MPLSKSVFISSRTCQDWGGDTAWKQNRVVIKNRTTLSWLLLYKQKKRCRLGNEAVPEAAKFKNNIVEI